MTTPSTGARPQPRANALTVDVEEWFHICGVPALAEAHWDTLPSRVVVTTRALLEDLDRAGVRATFFVLGWIAERYPDLVAEIRAGGHDIGSHGHRHVRVYDLDVQSFVTDVRSSVTALRAAGVDRIDGFRAPEWSINDRSLWALEHLVREGIAVDASMAPCRIVGRIDYPRAPHLRQTAAGPIVEAPPLVVDRYGHAMPMGWGWGLRMTSPRRMIRTIAKVNAAGHPAVLTVHPWEIDADPPRVSLPPRLRFAHYFCINGFRQRLAAMLSAIELGALSDVPALKAAS